MRCDVPRCADVFTLLEFCGDLRREWALMTRRRIVCARMMVVRMIPRMKRTLKAVVLTDGVVVRRAKYVATRLASMSAAVKQRTAWKLVS